MARIDLNKEPKILKIVKKRLKNRGLKPIYLDEWVVHGPHKDLPYEIYVGNAREAPPLRTIASGCVAIYPKAIYAIDNPTDWWNAKKENIIPVI